jgi:imidazole glycerol phosphate synthase glutamine amidotransferase subunit
MPADVVHIVSTGSANLASVCAAVERVGGVPAVTQDPDAVRSAERLILPGVGSFGAAMRELNARSLAEPLTQRIRDNRPTLGICLGLQVLCSASEESPGVPGLGIVPGKVTRLAGSARLPVPQMTWNRVLPMGSSLGFDPGWAYYANSYRLAEPPEGWSVATTDYGGRFVAAMQRGSVLACQFHPELSGPWGLDLIRRWLLGVETSSAVSASATAFSRPPSRVIPCLDVKDGRVVKGVQFGNLRDMGDPASLASAYEQQGADEIVLLDVSATVESRRARLRTVQDVRRAISVPLTVGGGVRTREDAAALLDAGADKVSVNTAAVADPDLIRGLADVFGRQCVVVAIDAAKRGEGWSVVVRSGSEHAGLDAVAWAMEAADRGAGEILLTSHDRDGTRAGYDLDLLRAVTRRVGIPVIASGGASTPDQLAEAIGAGASAVLAASIFHESQYSVRQVKSSLARSGVEVRP